MGEIKGLAAIIQGSIARIEEALIEAGKPNNPGSKAREITFPSSHIPWSRESEAGRMIPAVLESISVLVAAASQLINATRPPTLTLTTVATSVGILDSNLSKLVLTYMQAALPASLGVAARAHVAEICHEAGEEVNFHFSCTLQQRHLTLQKYASLLERDIRRPELFRCINTCRALRSIS